MQRDRKYLVPTEDGEKLLLILPDSMKSPKQTADWENALTLVAKGELAEDTFLRGIEAMVKEMIESNSKPKTEYRKFFVRELLAGKQILLKGLTGKNNRTYDVFLKPTGIEEYLYEKNGETVTGYQFMYEKSYQKKSSKTKKK